MNSWRLGMAILLGGIVFCLGSEATYGTKKNSIATLDEGSSAAANAQHAATHAQNADAEKTITRVVRYAFSVQNPGETTLTNVRLHIMAPVAQTASQQCLRLTSRPPAEHITDDLGNQHLLFTFSSLAPHATEIVRIEAEIALYATPRPTPLAAEMRQHLVMPAQYIQSTRPEIIALAATHAKPSTLETAKALTDWVATMIQRDLPSARDRGARRTLELRRGDCTDMAYLLAALCRARDIPTRVMAGFMIERNAVLRPEQFHNWTELHDGTTWRLADAFTARFDRDIATYLAMRIVDDRNSPAQGGWQRFHVEPQGAVRVRMLQE